MNGLNYDFSYQANAFYGIVISGNWVVNEGRVGVWVNNCDNRDTELAAFRNGNFLVFDVDNKYRAGELGDVLNALKVARHFAADCGSLFCVELVELSGGFHIEEFFVFFEAGEDSFKVGESSAEPAVYAEGHSACCGRFAQDFLRLALCADKHYVFVVGDYFLDKCNRFFKLRVGFFQVDNGNPRTVVVNEGL